MGRPKQFDPDAAVATAMDLFWRKGYGATTPADLVEELGIGKGSLYNTFENKRALFEQALRRYGDERVAGLMATLAQPGPVRARLQAALERLATPERAKLRRRGCLAVNTAAEFGDEDEAAAAIVRGIFERMARALQATIEEGQRTGEIDAHRNAKDIASLMLTTILGMTVLAKVSPKPDALVRAVRAAMAAL
ncbi:TetR/AcrR family transcriptional regulator [Pendulispora brunnea]|uniref:TetR/AcrR family transcriptional regulator n=1 Tax=Pendulispora brunnea TaxID=2905690 RepID=A0ABZ2K601_9BACT